MQIQVNKEIRDVEDDFVAGLNVRKTLASGLCIGVCVASFLYLKNTLGFDEVNASAICVVMGLPIAAFGFIKWHGLAFERAILAWIFYLLTPRKLVFKGKNEHDSLVKTYLNKQEGNSKYESDKKHGILGYFKGSNKLRDNTIQDS